MGTEGLWDPCVEPVVLALPGKVNPHPRGPDLTPSQVEV